MTKLDYYERHLLALAVEAAREHGLQLSPTSPRGWKASVWMAINNRAAGYGDTLVDALTALLTDLNVQVPERPSEEAVRHARIEYLSGVQPRDPLLAAAVLEAGR